MKRAPDGLPIVGSNSKELGVRVPPDPNADIDLDQNDHVIQNGNGMSVAKNWRNLLAHLVPKRLKQFFPGAVGSNSLTCYRMGTGLFAPSPINNNLTLALKPGSAVSGNVAPIQSVLRDQFQANLAATRAEWTPDET